MSIVTFFVLGLGSGAAIAALALGVIVAHRASRVVNFAHGAMGTYVAMAYYELRATGDLVLPVLGLPARVHVVARPTTATALVACLVLAALLGAVVYLAVFRFLRQAPPLARVVASLGLFVYLIGVMGLRFTTRGSAAIVLDGPLPDRLVTVGRLRVPADRYLLAALVVVAAAVLWAFYRKAPLGVATRAVASNERGAVMLGVSPTPVGVVNWMIAAVLAGGAVILAAPIVRLDPSTTSLLIVPALAAALPGRFDSFSITVVTGLAIGMAQSGLLNLQREWAWLPDVGLQQGVPFAVVLATLAWRGSVLPDRTGWETGRLARIVDIPNEAAWVGAIGATGVGLALVLGSAWRSGLVLTATATVIALSVVVLAGYVAQVSLATYALAGIAAFTMVHLADAGGWPFPLDAAAGVAVAVAAGQLVAWPSSRVRGLSMAIGTLAAAVAVEELVFKWSWFTGGLEGATVEPAELLGIDLGIAAVGDAYPRRTFVVVVIVAAVVAVLAVGNLRRSATGRRWLAVRANERAAAAAGISVARAKASAFATASAVAGAAGVLLGHQRQIVSSGSFTVFDSLVAVAIAALAGVTSPIGAVVAGVLASGGLLTVALDQLSDGTSRYQFAVNGLLLVVAAIRFPDGIVGTPWRRRSRRGTLSAR